LPWQVTTANASLSLVSLIRGRAVRTFDKSSSSQLTTAAAPAPAPAAGHGS